MMVTLKGKCLSVNDREYRAADGSMRKARQIWVMPEGSIRPERLDAPENIACSQGNDYDFVVLVRARDGKDGMGAYLTAWAKECRPYVSFASIAS